MLWRKSAINSSSPRISRVSTIDSYNSQGKMASTGLLCRVTLIALTFLRVLSSSSNCSGKRVSCSLASTIDRVSSIFLATPVSLSLFIFCVHIRVHQNERFYKCPVPAILSKRNREDPPWKGTDEQCHRKERNTRRSSKPKWY